MEKVHRQDLFVLYRTQVADPRINRPNSTGYNSYNPQETIPSTPSRSDPKSPSDGGASSTERNVAARWDKPDANDVSSSEGSESSHELMVMARRARSGANEFKLSESPKRSSRASRDRPRTPVRPPRISCRSEADRASPEHMAKWRLCSPARVPRPP